MKCLVDNLLRDCNKVWEGMKYVWQNIEKETKVGFQRQETETGLQGRKASAKLKPIQ